MMARYSVYDLTTGAFTGRRILCLAREARINTPTGCGLVEGEYDKHAHRVDVAEGVVVAYQRHASEIVAEQKAASERQARQRIAALEDSQHRPLRDLVLDPNNAEAKRRLAKIDAEIAALRLAVN